MDLIQQLKRDEGMRLLLHRDTAGKFTIGVGRNLTDIGITPDEAEYLLANDVHRVMVELNHALPWLGQIDAVRRGALYNMAFNLGIKGLLNFSKMLAAIERKDYVSATKEMLASRWMIDVGDRSIRLANQIRTGAWV
jgi:lysozyme